MIDPYANIILNIICDIIFKATDTDWDHSIEDKDFTVIWARGQEYGMYVHDPNSGVEAGTNKDAQFYKRDELKYHGHNPQRGSVSQNFYRERRFIY